MPPINDRTEPWEPPMGYCRETEAIVSDLSCVDCFCSPEMRTVKAKHGNRRMRCVEDNMTESDGTGVTITADALNRLSEESVRGILGNACMVANHDPGPTARTLRQEVALHLSEGVG